jgi:predicted nucleic acid-binding protein
MLAVVDTGPLYASLDRDDADHEACAGVLRRDGLRIAIPMLVVAEVSYLAATRLGAEVEATFIQTLSTLDVDAPPPREWTRIAELIRQYADFPLGATDASVVALAERLGTPHVVTLDRRHFLTVRPRHCEALQLLPE